jgi:hypothetical protein
MQSRTGLGMATSGPEGPARWLFEARPLPRRVIAALAGEAARVRSALPGQRTQLLFCASVALGQLVAGGQLDENIARDRLREACTGHVRAGAYTADEADATISSGFARGAEWSPDQPPAEQGLNQTVVVGPPRMTGCVTMDSLISAF